MMGMHEGQFFMVYQPKITAGTNELSGFEAVGYVGSIRNTVCYRQ